MNKLAMPQKNHTKIINVEPGVRRNILDSDIEKICGRDIPNVKVTGTAPIVFYMQTLSQIFIVGKSVTAINKTAKEIADNYFPESDRIGGIQKNPRF